MDKKSKKLSDLNNNMIKINFEIIKLLNERISIQEREIVTLKIFYLGLLIVFSILIVRGF